MPSTSLSQITALNQNKDNTNVNNGEGLEQEQPQHGDGVHNETEHQALIARTEANHPSITQQ
jgi:hypothetical protein